MLVMLKCKLLESRNFAVSSAISTYCAHGLAYSTCLKYFLNKLINILDKQKCPLTFNMPILSLCENQEGCHFKSLLVCMFHAIHQVSKLDRLCFPERVLYLGQKLFSLDAWDFGGSQDGNRFEVVLA